MTCSAILQSMNHCSVLEITTLLHFKLKFRNWM